MIAPSTKVLLSAGLAGLAAAVPFTSPEINNGTFSVRTRAKPAAAGSGPIAYAKAYRKYGAPVPANLAAAVANAKIQKRQSSPVTTTPVDTDEEWITPVSIGTPAQVLNLDFDTGSSDLWVFSSLTPASSIDGQTTYKPGQSSTAALKSGYTWTISYGDGSSSSGVVYDDVVKIGTLSVAAQAVEAAEKVSTEFTEDTNSDGLLGLGFSTINSVKPTAQLTWFDNIKSDLTTALFTADLNSEAAGTYDFGAIDTTKYTGTIAYTAVGDKLGYWGMAITNYQIGATGTKGASITGIADTGTTLLLLPTAVVEAYYATIASAKYSELEGGYTVTCSATLPEFIIYIGTTPITIPGSYIAYAPLTTGGATCFGGIQTNTGIGFSIFGDIALKAAFVVFDKSTATPRIGWATKTLTS